jgi:hypothetical protein
LKSQVIVDLKTKQIICTAHGKERQHDFKLLKTSQVKMIGTTVCLADKGYQGIKKLHPNSQIPIKKPRGGQLSAQSKQQNRDLARRRVVGENVHRCLKIFKIVSQRYRNRRTRFELRFNLIAGFYNYERSLAAHSLTP